MIPIFDSLTHPTLDGKWLNRDTVATFDDLKSQMKQAYVPFAIACGINGNGYNHEEYFSVSSNVDGLIPIARLNMSADSLEQEIQHIYDIGYKGIKIHPTEVIVSKKYKLIPAPNIRTAQQKTTNNVWPISG